MEAPATASSPVGTRAPTQNPRRRPRSDGGASPQGPSGTPCRGAKGTHHGPVQAARLRERLLQSRAEKRTTSQGGTGAAGGVVEGRAGRFPPWPEWSDAEVNAEKWDGPRAGGGKEKGRSPSLNFFEDPEGKIELPPSLKVHAWKRPQDFITDRVPVVVEDVTGFDLLTPNTHLLHSELMRSVISDVTSLWRATRSGGGSAAGDPAGGSGGGGHPGQRPWNPWEHVYSLCKAGRAPHVPQFNGYGKYVVRLYWMGCWRRVTVDDTVPFDEAHRALLPACTGPAELWPVLLTKAIVKLASVHCVGRSGHGELGEFTVLHCLTGWIPEVIPLRAAHAARVWGLLRELLPEFRLPPEDGVGARPEEHATPGVPAEPAIEEPPPAAAADPGPPNPTAEPPAMAHGKDCRKEAPPKAAERGTPADRTDGKEGGRRKGKDVEKEKRRAAPSESVSPVVEERSSANFPTLPDKPEVVVFASYRCPASASESFSVLGRMADAAQKLREAGLSPVCPHLLHVSRTRSSPLVPPPRSPPVPPWKLVRPRKSKPLPRDEPEEPEVKRAEQFVEISSPFLDQRLSCIPSAPGFIVEAEEQGEESQKRPAEPAAENPSDAPRPPPPEPHPPEREPSPVVAGPGESPVPQGTVDGRGEARPADETQATRDPRDKSDTWIHFEDFCTAFQSLLVYHKPHTYAFNHDTGDMKNAAAAAAAAAAGGKAATSSTASLSATIAKAPQAGVEERAPLYLLMDSVGPSQLIVCLSVLPRWGAFGWHESRKDDAEAGGSAGPGSLVASHHSWTQPVKYGSAALRIHTSASKAMALCLPPGRHVLCLRVMAPHGLHLHACSSTRFLLGDEDSVLPHLAKESCRFTEHALGTMRALGGVAHGWAQGPAPQPPLTPHGLLGIDTAGASVPGERSALRQIVTRSLCHVLASALSGAVPSDLPFALHALTGDLSLPGLTTGTAPEGRAGVPPETWGGARVVTSEEAAAAAVRVQALWRGHYARRLCNARKPGTAESATVKGTLGRVWALLEPGAERHGAALLRHVLMQDARLLGRFPFAADEGSRATFADYSGSCSDQPPHSWFLLFRAVFRVPEETRLSAELHSPAPRSSLHIVDNDTGRLLHRSGRGGPRCLVRSAVFAPNKSGYTFVGDAESGESPVGGGGRWRLRIVGSGGQLPVPEREPIAVAFAARDVREHYVPGEQGLAMRYRMKASVDQLVSLRVHASLASARLSLALLEGERTVASATGRGDAAIVAAALRGARRRSATQRAPASNGGAKSPTPMNPAPPPVRKSGGGHKTGRATAASSSSASSSTTTSRPPSGLAPAPPQSEAEARTQTLAAPEMLRAEPEQPAPVYVLEMRVLCDSWPLSDDDNAFAETLREKERAELKLVVEKPEEQSAGTEEAPASVAQADAPRGSAAGAGGSSTARTTRRGKGAGDKDRGKQGGAPADAQPALEVGRPHWTLRVLSDATEEPLTLWRDTDRADGARHVKLAWELAEPGRAAKALKARREFLSKMRAAQTPAPPPTGEVTPSPLADESGGQAAGGPRDEPPAEPLRLTFDPSPFFRGSCVEAAVKDRATVQEEEQRRAEEEIRQFRQRREELLERRERGRKERAEDAARLTTIYEQLQAAVREARCRALAPREIFVERLEEAARLHAAEKEAREAALRAPQPAPSPKSARKRSPKGSAVKKRGQ
ncbi:androglobin isoform X2 [Petromyzon marinus]|uniref:androglobin isoform X2 n=1 Tax=Petromyzon marinus TaxID=7757 RepID=UPI003F6EABDD